MSCTLGELTLNELKEVLNSDGFLNRVGGLVDDTDCMEYELMIEWLEELGRLLLEEEMDAHIKKVCGYLEMIGHTEMELSIRLIDLV